MKITVFELRKIIRESLEEQGWVPGRWMPTTGEPVDGDELGRLGQGGFLEPSLIDLEEIEELEENDEEVEK